MGIYDRDYSHDGYGNYRGGGRMLFARPMLEPVVKWLLIINFAVFVAEVLFFGGMREQITIIKKLFAVYPGGIHAWQLWRYVSYQFLHYDLMHILFNMLGVYLLGPVLEKHWGSRRFLKFYLSCGVAGGLCYPLLVHTGILGGNAFLVGASGSILGMLAACAILFPHFLVFFIVPIRIFAGICILCAVLIIASQSANAGGEAAHLGGLIAGGLYVLASARDIKLKAKPRKKTNTFEKKNARQRSLQKEVDRILDKVSKQGINSLSRKEKQTLEEATRLEQSRNKR